MEAYESPEHLTLVKEVREGDRVAIPCRNYPPVFSPDSPLEFIWCIAGDRYWVGDKNPAFMTYRVSPPRCFPRCTLHESHPSATDQD